MTTEAIITAVVVWVIYIGALGWCFSKLRSGGRGWDD
jgi:hypothetical protein